MEPEVYAEGVGPKADVIPRELFLGRVVERSECNDVPVCDFLEVGGWNCDTDVVEHCGCEKY